MSARSASARPGPHWSREQKEHCVEPKCRQWAGQQRARSNGGVLLALLTAIVRTVVIGLVRLGSRGLLSRWVAGASGGVGGSE